MRAFGPAGLVGLGGRFRGGLVAYALSPRRRFFTSRASTGSTSPSSTAPKPSAATTTATATGTSRLYEAGHRGNRPGSADMIAFMDELRKGTGHGSVELRRSDRDERVLELLLRNERSRNSLTGKMMCQLHDIMLELTCPSSPYKGCAALILRGEGSAFCSGADFHLADKIASPAQGVLMAELMTNTLTRLRRAPLVTVACLGNALGGGAELSTAADFRVMAPGSKVQFVQARMGVSCGWGGTSRLVRLVGRRQALQLLGAAVPLDAAQAEAAGFADLVCEEGEDLEHAAWRLLHPFLRHTTEALRSIKMGVAAADDLGWDAARDVETDAFKLTWGSEANKHALKTARERIASSPGAAGAGSKATSSASKRKKAKEQ